MKALTKLILVAVIGLLATFGIILYLIEPSLNQVLRLNQELKDKKIETKTLEQQILAFKTAQSDLSRATQKDRILNAIVNKEDLVMPVKNLEAAALNTNSEHILKITDPETVFNPGQAPKDAKLLTKPINGVKEITFDISVKNDFLGVLNFVRYVENSPYFTELTNLELSGEATGALNPATGQASGIHTGQVLGNFKGVFYIIK